MSELVKQDELVEISIEQFESIVLSKLKGPEARMKKLIKETPKHIEIKNKAQFEIVQADRMELVNYRLDVSKLAKELRDPQTVLNRKLSAKEKKMLQITAAEEERLTILVRAWQKEEEERIEAEKQIKLNKLNDRIARLAAYGEAMEIQDLETMEDVDFEAHMRDIAEEKGSIKYSNTDFIQTITGEEKSVVDPSHVSQAFIGFLVSRIEAVANWDASADPKLVPLLEPFKQRLLDISKELQNLKLD